MSAAPATLHPHRRARSACARSPLVFGAEKRTPPRASLKASARRTCLFSSRRRSDSGRAANARSGSKDVPSPRAAQSRPSGRPRLLRLEVRQATLGEGSVGTFGSRRAVSLSAASSARARRGGRTRTSRSRRRRRRTRTSATPTPTPRRPRVIFILRAHPRLPILRTPSPPTHASRRSGVAFTMAAFSATTDAWSISTNVSEHGGFWLTSSSLRRVVRSRKYDVSKPAPRLTICRLLPLFS